MTKTKKITRRIISVASTLVMALTMFSTNVFAKESIVATESNPAVIEIVSSEDNGISPAAGWVSVGSFGAGDYQIEYVNFRDKTEGDIRTYNTRYMQIKPAWKATDSSASEVELLVKVIRKSNGNVAYSHRFKLTEDTDGHKDGQGWWYAESVPFEINRTSDYFFYYEVFTADGYQSTGNKRAGEVHMWVELHEGISEFYR